MPRSSSRFFDRPSCKLATGALVAILLCAAGAHADDLDASAEDLGAGTGELGAPAENPGAPIFSFSGFGTVGLVHSSEDKADYTDSVFKPNGAGHSHTWSADVDSRLGLQITANVSPKLSAVLQIISEQKYDNTYTPHVEWANIKYAFTPDFSVRLGRIDMAPFLVGDYRKVGYSVPWLRPPSEVYNMMPVTNNDGIDASYRSHFGDATNTLQALYGRDRVHVPSADVAAKARNTLGVFDTLEYGPTTLRASYLATDLTVGSTTPLFDAYRLFGPPGVVIADKYNLDNRRISFVSLGASYDPGKWFVMGEWIKGRFNSFLGDQTAWYASGGYRIGNFTPYVTYSQLRKLSNTTDPGLNPLVFGPAAGFLNAQLNFLLAPKTSRTIAIGSRWDFMKNVDLKLQYEHIDLGANSSGTLVNLQPGFQPGGKVNLISATIDFVF